MIPSEYKTHKGLREENLRDHMTDLELIFSMLGEAATKEIAVNQDDQGFDENKVAANTGGKIAGDARRHLEQESGKPVISQDKWLGIALDNSRSS
jgi:DNA-damage-inducible protein D